MDDKKYVLEWSKNQNAFHIQPLEFSLAKNQDCFLREGSSDYLTLMVGSHDACTNMADNQQARLIERTGLVATC